MTELSTPEQDAPRPAYVHILGLRTGWLNALIIGATIVVWLSLIGSVLLGAAFAAEIISDEPIFEFPIDDDDVVNVNCPPGKVLDSRGFCVE